MPDVAVFVALDTVSAFTDETLCLPTRAELQEWLNEHDKIEKETEIFDSGELKKLRELTKGMPAFANYPCKRGSNLFMKSCYMKTSFTRRYRLN